MGAAEITRELLGHLQWERNHLSQEREVLLRERECLVRQDLEGILECLKEKQTLQLRARILQESREALRARLSSFVQSKEGESTFQRLLEGLEEDQRRQLVDSRGELHGLLSEVQNLSEGNLFLIRSALGRIEGAIAVLGAAESPGWKRYNSGGSLEGSPLDGSRLLEQA